MENFLLNDDAIKKYADYQNRGYLQDALTECFEAVIKNNDQNAHDQLIALWKAAELDKISLASVRTQYNTISKKVKKKNGEIDPLGLTVKDGLLANVVPRSRQSKVNQFNKPQAFKTQLPFQRQHNGISHCKVCQAIR